MAWFKKLALFLITVLPCVTAHPTVDSRHRPVFATEGLESEGQYIITLQNSLSPIEFRSHLSRVNAVQYRNSHDSNNHGSGGVHKTYAIGDYHAYSGTFDQDTIRAIWNDTKVADIELDTVYALQGHSQLVRQYKAPWGLAALSNKKRGSSTYRYDKSAGYGTFAYILDSGINTKHVDFGGRASLGYNAVNKDFTDVNGHGTHVAGIIGSKSFGVAKQTELIGVKVMINNEAFVSTILDGYQWAVNDILTKNRQNRAVINMSLGGPASRALNGAIDTAFRLGILTVVASGNEGIPARYVSPASAPNAFTVGAIDPDWNEWEYSNYGPEVNILAPGIAVESTYISTDNATSTLSGTSMAAPHVAGLAMYLAAYENIGTA